MIVFDNQPSMICDSIFQLEDLKKPSVHIKDKERVEAIVCDLIKGGTEKLQVGVTMTAIVFTVCPQ